MRTIKFRGWDGKKMLEAEDLSIAPKYRKWLGKKDVELIQWTGLLDRHGVEIYEGDIVKDCNSLMDFPCSVEFVKGAFRATGEDGPALDEWEGLEVLGNIYENSEILEIEL